MSPAARLAAIEAIAAERILILDGAMGTEIQAHALNEADFRGARFADHPKSLKGDNDLLCLTRPDIIRAIHEAYLEAGADIISTNTFNATSISQADYGLEAMASAINIAAARLAREAGDAFEARTGAPKLVAGAIGPTSKTLSLSPDVNNPAFREISFEQLAGAYREQALALIEGGADVLLIETIFDTLNAKAAIFALEEVFETLGRRLPIMLSGTITDLSGRTLSGQTVEAFWCSVAHAEPWSVGLNCALGPKEMEPYIRTLARIAGCRISAYPNAGLPNAMGGYDETPEQMVAIMGAWAREGLLNVIGGCCGTTPAHVRTFAAAVRGAPIKPLWSPSPALRLSGLEMFVAGA